MPIYEYRCRICGAVTEVLVMSAGSQRGLVCRTCGEGDLEKMPSAPAAVTIKNPASGGRTCCGKEERCDSPPCSSGGICRRD